MNTFAVVGYNLEGLLAAHALNLAGNSVVLFDTQTPTHAPFSHDAFITMQIPGLTENVESAEGVIRQLRRGKDYKKKAFPDINTSQTIFAFKDGEPVWSPVTVWEKLIQFYPERLVNKIDLYNADSLQVVREHYKWDALLVSAPKPNFCNKANEFTAGCTFNSSPVFVSDMIIEPLDYTHVYDATDERSWIKQIDCVGRLFTEFAKPHPYMQCAEYTRPISTNCKCHDDVFWIGRYGKWEGLEIPHQQAMRDALSLVM